MALLCDRPHSRFVDFGASRFVVSTGRGLNISGQKYERGDEVPQGVLSAEALRQQYEPPLRNIELFEFALTDPSLREACARRGINLEEEVEKAAKASQSAATIEVYPDLDTMTRREMVEFCEQYGLSATGNTHQLRKRITAALLE
jgi:hypothetical protein